MVLLEKKKKVRVKRLYKGVVNGDVVYKWASSSREFERLCMRDYLRRFGKCNITDVRVV